MIHVLKIRESIKWFKETENSRYIYQNELDKACFQHDIAYGDCKELNRREVANKAFNIAKDPKYDEYQRGLASVVYKLFNKKTCGSSFKHKNISNK